MFALVTIAFRSHCIPGTEPLELTHNIIHDTCHQASIAADVENLSEQGVKFQDAYRLGKEVRTTLFSVFLVVVAHVILFFFIL